MINNDDKFNADDLVQEVEKAERSRKVFDDHFSEMKKAVELVIRTKEELFEWLKKKGFELDSKTFNRWWTAKGVKAKKAAKKAEGTHT